MVLMGFDHVTVLREKSVELMNINPDGIYVDGTLGGGGHSELILSKLRNGKLIGIDQDMDAIKAASERLKKFGEKAVFVHSNFKDVKNVVRDLGIDKIDGFLIDLGVSSYQLDEAKRGFSYMNDGLLDMRMNREVGFSAFDVVNTYSKEEIERIIFEYGEEKWARRISEFIVEERKNGDILTTFELVEIIKKAVPAGARRDGPHPAKRTFQAIRIEVNDELNIIKGTIEDVVDILNHGGRVSVITFHSLEDRIVKNVFRDLAKGCICPPEIPVCVCNNKPKIKVITRKPILPDETEIGDNPRARSAKLRVAVKL